MEQLDRDLSTVGSHFVPQEFLQSLFVAELLFPSERLWVISPWISDVAIIDNTARQFSALNPDWPATYIRLSAILQALIERGTQVVMIVNDDGHNEEFRLRVGAFGNRYPGQMVFITQPNLHEKGILGDTFTLDGSMNFTYNGVYVNEEHLIYRCDPAKIAERRLTLMNRWGDRLC
jgi:phosphatidylserine/phosphatidylglycerophosphate/cardiolipin synthase-like enzyme